MCCLTKKANCADGAAYCDADLRGVFTIRVSQRQGAKRDTLNIRIKPEVRGLIDRAAKLIGKNRTDFVLDAARHAAEDTLLDRTVFVVSPRPTLSSWRVRMLRPSRMNVRVGA